MQKKTSSPLQKNNHNTDAQRLQPNEKKPLQIAIEICPLVVFFVTNYYADIYWGTLALMVATTASVVASRVWFGHMPKMLLVSCGFVIAFGAMTLWAHDERFIKIKVTIVNLVFSTVLFGGLVAQRPLLPLLLETAFSLTNEGWRLLTIRWATFFLCMACLNEIIWRSFSTDFWVSFKVFGIIPITLLFAISQVKLIEKYQQNRN